MPQALRSTGIRRPWQPGPPAVAPESTPRPIRVSGPPAPLPGAQVLVIGRRPIEGPQAAPKGLGVAPGTAWPPGATVLMWGRPLEASAQPLDPIRPLSLIVGQVPIPGASVVSVAPPRQAPTERPWPVWVVQADPTRPGAVTVWLQRVADEPAPVVERPPFGPLVVRGWAPTQDARSYRVGWPFEAPAALPGGLRVLGATAPAPGAYSIFVGQPREGDRLSPLTITTPEGRRVEAVALALFAPRGEGGIARPPLVIVPQGTPPEALALLLRALRDEPAPVEGMARPPVVLSPLGLPVGAQAQWIGRPTRRDPALRPGRIRFPAATTTITMPDGSTWLLFPADTTELDNG